jgi:hypothetical protein
MQSCTASAASQPHLQNLTGTAAAQTMFLLTVAALHKLENKLLGQRPASFHAQILCEDSDSALAC